MFGAAGRSVASPSTFGVSAFQPYAVDRSLNRFQTTSPSPIPSSPSVASSSAGRVTGPFSSPFSNSHPTHSDRAMFTQASTRPRHSHMPRLSAAHQNREGSTRSSSAGKLEIHQRIQHLGGFLGALREQFTEDVRHLQAKFDGGFLEFQRQLLELSHALYSDESVQVMEVATELQQNQEVAAAEAAAASSTPAGLRHRFFIPVSQKRDIRKILRELQRQTKPLQDLHSAEEEEAHAGSTAKMRRDRRIMPKSFTKQSTTRKEKLIVVEYCLQFRAGIPGQTGTPRSKAVQDVVKALENVVNISVKSVKRWIRNHEKGKELPDGRVGDGALFNPQVLRDVCKDIKKVHLSKKDQISVGPQLNASVNSLLPLMGGLGMLDETNSSPSEGAAAKARSSSFAPRPPVHQKVHELRVQAAKRKKYSPHKSQGRGKKSQVGDKNDDDDDAMMGGYDSSESGSGLDVP